MQINRWLYLSSSLWEISLHCNLFTKWIDPKNLLFIEANKLIVLTVQWSVKYFLLRIREYSGYGKQKSRRRTEAIAKRFAFHANAKK